MPERASTSDGRDYPLGLDHALHGRFKRWADDILSVTPEPEDPAHAARVRATIAELCGYLREVIAARRRAPADDTVSDLIRSDVDGQSLADAEIVDVLFTVLLGGLETTTWNCSHIANASIRGRIETMCRATGLQPPLICTPEELVEE